LFFVIFSLKLTMKIRYSQKILDELESFFKNLEYKIRYEKGNFQAGYCLLSGQKIIVINKYFTTEGKINAFIEILKKTEIIDLKIIENSSSTFQKIIEELKNTQETKIL
jgi:hypothetical protein